MKIRKGDAGYIRLKKKKAFLKTILEFGIVLALLILGIMQTGDRMNLLTIVAILGCLPAAKALVELIMILPHHSVSEEMSAEIDLNAESLTRVYDLIFTSEKNVMPVECVVIMNNTVCGYASSEKTDLNIVANHLKQYLYANKLTDVSVKIFDNYTAFVTRAEGMNNIASIDKKDTKERELTIRQVLLNLSL